MHAQTGSWDTEYEFKIILILSLAFGLVGLDRFILPVLFPSMMGELGLTYDHLGLLVGILAIFWGIAAFGMGYMSDRLGRRKVLVPAVVLFSLLSALSGVATGLLSLLIIRAVMGAAEGPVASTGVAASFAGAFCRCAKWTRISPKAPMITFCSAAVRPFHCSDCHITNHSPPIVMNPPRKRITCISQPVDDRRAAACVRPRSHVTNAEARTTAVRASHAMIRT